jgi:predicted RNA polymerase sigma factor
MSQSDDTSGFNEFRLPADAPAQDVFDQALSDILGKDNPHAYPILRAIQRPLRQYHLADQYEVHEILHEAYLRGKKKLQAGEVIRNPYAWLRATAFHVIYERKRKHRSSSTDPQIMEAVLPDPRLNLMQQQVLLEELDLLYESLALMHQEDPEGTCLLYLRNVRALSWSQISHWLAAEGQAVPNEATLRQRASRAKRRLRDIFWQRVHEGATRPDPQPPIPCELFGQF